MIVISFILLLALQAPAPEQRAVDYVAAEVPRWPAENHCFSCHNNGDGARALLLASRMKQSIPAEALEKTADWLQKPNEWGKSGTTGLGDEKLARIQFGAALADALDAGLVRDRSLLTRAAELLLTHQEADGSWQVDAQGASPSAVTYGPVLATFMARRTLESSGDSRFSNAIARADKWLSGADVSSTVNAAAVVLAFQDREDAAFKSRLQQAVSVLLNAQNASGGWGAYPKTPGEPFETAMALLALNSVRDKPDVEERIARGRAFLVMLQSEDGGWAAETTYARHISTSAWATQALLSTKR
jgi:Prenyltransferase and squalene oxidase repeat